MKYLVIIFAFSLYSCTTFSEYSKFNYFNECEERSFLCVKNDSLSLNYKSFGGIRFANNIKEYRKMKVENKPKFKNVITYGKSNILKGDYYLILDNRKYSDDFFFRDTIINDRKITIALSKKIDYKTNRDFLLNFDQNK